MRRSGFLSSAALIAVALLLGATSATAAVITQWTFEPGTAGNPPAATGTTITGVSAATGTGTASGQHASAATVWDNPSGNGSPESMSSNNWGVDDYYQFQTSTVGSTRIGLTLDHTSSNTGPRDFKIQYSTTGVGAFIDTGRNYSVLPNAAPNPLWGATPANPPVHTYKFDLSSIGALNNQASLFLRLVNTSTVSANGGTVATGGTSRLDNVTISNNVPEPGTVLLVATAGIFFGFVGRRVLR
jgi:hypothetical protein